MPLERFLPTRSARATERSGGTASTGGPFRNLRNRRRRRAASSSLAALCLAPLLLAASPSPSPSLDTVLAAPAASGYIDDNDPAIPLQGDFTIEDYLNYVSASDAVSTDNTLRRLGFVAGYAHTWMQSTSSHLLLEAVIAFSGASGATRWMSTSEAMDKRNASYARSIVVGGLASYYAWHAVNASAPEYADFVGFVKGNDYFIVIADSTAEDLGDTAPVQSKHQFDAAPPYTIPPSQWPEYASRNVLAYRLVILLVGFMVVLVAIGVGVAALLQQRYRTSGL